MTGLFWKGRARSLSRDMSGQMCKLLFYAREIWLILFMLSGLSFNKNLWAIETMTAKVIAEPSNVKRINIQKAPIKSIALTVQTNITDMHISWILYGLGHLEGDTTSSQVHYI